MTSKPTRPAAPAGRAAPPAAPAADPRLNPPPWEAAPPRARHRLRVRLLIALAIPLTLFYFTWLLAPERIGSPVLYAILVAAELFNVAQAVGFWWTCSRERDRQPCAWSGPARPQVDLLVPVYGEPVAVVEPTIAAAVSLPGAEVRVHLLDDGGDDEMRALAQRHGARYVRRPRSTGAKAGNVNDALRDLDAPFVVVLDCDHVPRRDFLTATLGHLQRDRRLAFVQTPQHYANAGRGGVAAAAWSQQALFFGAIARGKDGHDAMFCCGTNVVFRRAALDDAGGFPEESLTEDFELSVHLHERGWRTAYLPRVLADGLGPEDMAAYVGQQYRWARGCLGGIATALRAKLPWRQRAHYLLSGMYFLSGWTLLAYMAFPVVRIATGAQPLAGATADLFLLHFGPYFGLALWMVALAGGGSYRFSAYALQAASAWIHVHASLAALTRRRGSFKVTPKEGDGGRQPRAVAIPLAVVAVLLGAALLGLARDQGPATLNNVAFALLHVCVLMSGVWPALRGSAAVAARDERRSAPVAGHAEEEARAAA
ncbi:glycosyltransferase family 2 protein [Conexibacter arvalis]|uniref:Cellulose synthase (UDP-forming) n=1 Tax=Conexibacter arvalis TaxID=912552 RepID=A0A840IAL8_9ACTN|nr:cellulose synthase catalytic subunit [Conexibacter arvalis]MBB4661939.1 cellulose synthase (UDP-forming) [Conexibacter arvalis]